MLKVCWKSKGLSYDYFGLQTFVMLHQM